jgi:hypothetical protein
MINQNSQFFAILTNIGAAKQANADALGVPWKISHMAIGDANGSDPIPGAAQTKLINEVRRAPLNQLKVDPANHAVIIAEQVIPADVGGWWIREIGLFDSDGDLVAVANCAPSFKPLLVQGSGRTQVVRLNIVVSNSDNVELKIDPSVVLASRAYVDAAILEVLPKNKTAGTFNRVKVSDRGIVLSGDNPRTLEGHGIEDAFTRKQINQLLASRALLNDLPYRGFVAWTVAGVYEWTVPPHVTKAYVVVTGGGGSGRNSEIFGPGGGAGGVAEDLVTLVPGTMIKITVGRGGAGVPYNGTGGVGLPGSSSSFGTFMSATGGTGGDSSGGGGRSGTGSGGRLNYGLGDGQTAGRLYKNTYGFPGSGGGAGGAGVAVDAFEVGQTPIRNGQGPGGGGAGRMDNGGVSGAGHAGSVTVRY